MKRLALSCVLVLTGCGARNKLIVWHSPDWHDVIESNGVETVTMVDGSQVMFCCADVDWNSGSTDDGSGGTFEATYVAGDSQPANDESVQEPPADDQDVVGSSVETQSEDSQPPPSGTKENRQDDLASYLSNGQTGSGQIGWVGW